MGSWEFHLNLADCGLRSHGETGSYWRRATAAPIRPPIYETGSGWKKMKRVKLREGYQLERGDQLFLRK